MKPLELIRIACLAVIYLAPVAPVESAEIRYRSESASTSPIVRLGDVAEILAGDEAERERLAAFEIGPAPAVGQQLVLSPREVSDRLLLKGVNLASHTQSGASRITVVTAGHAPVKKERAAVSQALRQQAEDRVRASLVDYLRDLCDATPAWQIRFSLTDEQVHLVTRSSVKPVIFGGSDPWTGPQQFTVTVMSNDSAHPMTVSTVVSPAAQIVVTNRAIGRGERISESDVRLSTPTHNSVSDHVFHSLDQVVGCETTRSLAVDSAITADTIQAPLLVRKRDVVTVYSRSPGIRVRTTGRATEDGALGDLVLIESLSDRKTFFARVSGPQEAEIYARAPQAAQVSPANAVSHSDAARVR